MVPFDELAARGAARAPGSSPARTSPGTPAGWRTPRRWPPPASPVLLDGAQGLGAVPVDVRALGCDFYAASGQKWLCGPVGQRLPVRARRPDRGPHARRARLRDAWRTPSARSSSTSARARARFDGGSPTAASLGLGAGRAATCSRPTGSDTVHDARGPDLAARLAEMLADRGAHGGAARVARRWSRGRPPTPRRSRCGCCERGIRAPPPARARRTCARRWAPGPTRRSSSGCGRGGYFWVMTMMPNDHRGGHRREGHDHQRAVGHGRGRRMPIAAQVDRPRGAQDATARTPRSPRRRRPAR